MSGQLNAYSFSTDSQMHLTTAPTYFHFPPSGKRKPEDKFDIARSIPIYSWKYWQELDLAVGSQIAYAGILTGLSLVMWYRIAIIFDLLTFHLYSNVCVCVCVCMCMCVFFFNVQLVSLSGMATKLSLLASGLKKGLEFV